MLKFTAVLTVSGRPGNELKSRESKLPGSLRRERLAPNHLPYVVSLYPCQISKYRAQTTSKSALRPPEPPQPQISHESSHMKLISLARCLVIRVAPAELPMTEIIADFECQYSEFHMGLKRAVRFWDNHSQLDRRRCGSLSRISPMNSCRFWGL